MLKDKVAELERNFLQVAINIASMKTKLEDVPSKDWVHLRLWAVAGFIVAAVGLMIMLLPSAR